MGPRSLDKPRAEDRKTLALAKGHMSRALVSKGFLNSVKTTGASRRKFREGYMTRTATDSAARPIWPRCARPSGAISSASVPRWCSATSRACVPRRSSRPGATTRWPGAFSRRRKRRPRPPSIRSCRRRRCCRCWRRPRPRPGCWRPRAPIAPASSARSSATPSAQLLPAEAIGVTPLRLARRP